MIPVEALKEGSLFQGAGPYGLVMRWLCTSTVTSTTAYRGGVRSGLVQFDVAHGASLPYVGKSISAGAGHLPTQVPEEPICLQRKSGILPSS